MVEPLTLLTVAVGLVCLDILLAAHEATKRTTELKAVKQEYDGHFRALYGRFEEAETRLKKLEDCVSALAGAVDEKLGEFKEAVEANYASAATIDNLHDELFGVKSSLQQLASDVAPQKKTRAKKASKRR